jgi:pentapeptide MXKDX repeat protein
MIVGHRPSLSSVSRKSSTTSPGGIGGSKKFEGAGNKCAPNPLMHCGAVSPCGVQTSFRRRIMSKLIGIALATAVALSTSSAFAGDMKKDAMMKKDEMMKKEEMMKKDAMKGSMKKDAMMKKDEMKKDAMMKKDHMMKDKK